MFEDIEMYDEDNLLSKLNQSITNIKKMKNKYILGNIDDDLNYLENLKKDRKVRFTF